MVFQKENSFSSRVGLLRAPASSRAASNKHNRYAYNCTAHALYRHRVVQHGVLSSPCFHIPDTSDATHVSQRMRMHSVERRQPHPRFERCLDLLHKMPDMADLKPFPEQLSVEYISHAQSVRALDVSARGQWLATGRDLTTARCASSNSGREFFRPSLGAVNRVEGVQFNPLPARQSLLSVVCLHRCLLIRLLLGLGRGPQETRARAHSGHPPTVQAERRRRGRQSHNYPAAEPEADGGAV